MTTRYKIVATYEFKVEGRTAPVMARIWQTYGEDWQLENTFGISVSNEIVTPEGEQAVYAPIDKTHAELEHAEIDLRVWASNLTADRIGPLLNTWAPADG